MNVASVIKSGLVTLKDFMILGLFNNLFNKWFFSLLLLGELNLFNKSPLEWFGYASFIAILPQTKTKCPSLHSASQVLTV